LKKEEFEKEEKINFSKFISVFGGDIYIKWEDTFLVSFNDWRLYFFEKDKDDYKAFKNPSYIKTSIDKLEYWDIFIYEDDVENMEIESFNFFINSEMAYYISNVDWEEIIENFTMYNSHTNRKVYKFIS
jgi:hypothetical protein